MCGIHRISKDTATSPHYGQQYFLIKCRGGISGKEKFMPNLLWQASIVYPKCCLLFGPISIGVSDYYSA